MPFLPAHGVRDPREAFYLADPSEPVLSIVILTHDRKDSVLELLGQLQRDMKDIACECIVVDNHSSDGTPDAIRQRFPGVECLGAPDNIGVAGRNLGILRARAPIVVTLDDDILGLTASDAARLVGEFERAPQLGALSFRVVGYDTGRTCNWAHHRPISAANLRFATYEITEGAVAFRREALLSVGMYYEQFFIGHEGPDLAFRLMNAGYDVEYDGGYCVRHKHDQRGRPGWRFYYYETRNQIWLAARNMPFGRSFRYLFTGLSTMAAYSIRDGYFAHWFRAVVDGIRGLPAAWRTRSPWTEQTKRRIGEIDRHRPGFLYLIRVKLLQRDSRLEG